MTAASENTNTAHVVGRAILPHRSYRTLPRSVPGSVTALVASIACTLAVAISANPLVHLLTTIDNKVLHWTGVDVTVGSDQYLWTKPTPLLFTMPPHPWPQLVICIIGCVAAIALFSTALSRLEAPLRYFINFNLLIIGSEATYLLFVGHLGYSAVAFSTLMLRTTITTWLLVPPIIGLMAMLFPFSPLSSASLVVSCTLYELLLSFARYAAFIAVLTHTGPILMAAMYLLYGPLLDVLPIIGIYSLFLEHLARRIGRRPEAWAWL